MLSPPDHAVKEFPETARGRFFALVPAYRPDAALPQVISGLLDAGFDRVVVVDDGSGPQFAPLFQTLAAQDRVTLLTHAVNLGKGAALKTGFNHIAVLDPQAGIVTVDADGQHRAADAAAVRDALARRPDALILGARSFGRDHAVPWRSRFGNRVTRSIFRAVSGLAVSDTQTGLRGLSASFAASLLPLRSQRYEFELDMLLAAKRAGMAVQEVPIQTVYLDGNKSSHFNPVLDSFRIYFVLLRFLGASLTAALIDNGVFIALFAASGAIAGSQIGSRILATAVNYLMVHGFVFASGETHRRALPKYLALVLVLGGLSYAGIRLLHDDLGMPVVAAKLLMESLLYVANFLIQRHIIFRRPSE